MEHKPRTSLWVTLILVFIIAGGILFYLGLNPFDGGSLTEEETENVKPDTGSWVMYRNEEFGFEIMHPPDWEVAEFPEDEIAPAFNFYPRGTAEEPPFIHHTDAVNVSVFPNGVPTEGVPGDTVESNIHFAEPTENAFDFVTESGERWATFATFRDAPLVWRPWGFVWARASVDKLSVECRRDGRPIPAEQCDPPSGDNLVYRGDVSDRERAIGQAMLESFRFLESAERLSDLIRLISPGEGAVIGSPLTVRGQARGPWYFEATFPLVLTDWDGRIIARSFATAEGEWMTTEFVPFEGTIEFPPQQPGSSGVLILEKSNPSGLPENDNALEIPVVFE